MIAGTTGCTFDCKSAILKRSIVILLASFILFSCHKESFQDFEGSWMNVGEYRQQPNGNFEWTYGYGPGWHNFFTFYSDGRFGAHSDVPEGSGRYSYDRRSKTLHLNYEADAYGGTASTASLIVEKLESGRLVFAYYSSSGVLYHKTEYTRID